MSILTRAWERLALMISVAQSRAALAELEDRDLQDLGISASQARFEMSRPFWQVGAPGQDAGPAQGSRGDVGAGLRTRASEA